VKKVTIGKKIREMGKKNNNKKKSNTNKERTVIPIKKE
jgi:hypothetical protein